jgi:uncharacterized glyoxalase superfamily protein PhnB
MKASRLTPNFNVANIRETVGFYQDILGFKLVMAVPETGDGIEQSLQEGKEYCYVAMQKDDLEFMFERSDRFMEDTKLLKTSAIGASVSFYMEVEGIEDFYNELKDKNIETTELKTQWYGMREFYMQDNSGYVLGFAEKTE